ncbi:MAG: aspartate carbamoyltransferase catalytic subunit [Fibrobacterota bacterium]
MSLKIKHLMGLRDVCREDIEKIMEHALSFREILERDIKKVPILRGKTIVNLFFENSTRTRISFELAEKRLSGDSVNFTSSSSSVKKGETLKDTVRNIESMKIDMIVVRHGSVGVPEFLAECTGATIINAGDGANEHPTQALLDMRTILDHKKTISGLKVAIIGDVLHSRVTRSNIWGLKTMGADVTVCGPSTLMPLDMSEFGVKYTSRVEEALDGADVVMSLRLQIERQASGLLPSIAEYRNFFGINAERMKLAARDSIIMHPGPINRGIEMESDIADCGQSVILEQVTNGVAVRMAVLYLLGGGENEND